MSRMVLQKLLHPGMSATIRERGYDQVGGFVTDAAEYAADVDGSDGRRPWRAH